MPPSSPESSESSNADKAPASPARVYRLPFKPLNKSDSATRTRSPSSSTTKQSAGTGISKAKGKKPATSTPKQTQSLLSTLRTIKKDVSSKKDASSSKKELDRRDLLKRSHSAQSPLDVIGKAWLNAPKVERAEKKEIYDRFIPDRSSMDMANAQYNLAQKKSTSSLQELYAEACGITPNQRILAFRPEPPTKEDIKQRPEYTQRASALNPPQRRILTAPEKILDAPYMADDFYLNLLDWSSLNVVAIALDRAVYLWNADNGTIKALNYNSQDPVSSLAWSADGTFLAVGTTAGDTQVWDVEANTKLRSMVGQYSRVGSLSWDKHLVSSGARDGTIWHHDVRVAKHKVAELRAHEDEVCGLKWRWDGLALASGGNDNTVHVWDARSSKPKFTNSSHRGAVKALAWCPWSNSLLATGGGREDKHIHFWNSSTGARVQSVDTGSQVTSIIWSKHYKEIVSTHGYPNNHLTVWSYPNLNKIIDIPGHDSRILHSALSPDGQVVATAAADENLKFWRIFEHDGKELLGSNERSRQSQLRRSNSLR